MLDLLPSKQSVGGSIPPWRARKFKHLRRTSAGAFSFMGNLSRSYPADGTKI